MKTTYKQSLIIFLIGLIIMLSFMIHLNKKQIALQEELIDNQKIVITKLETKVELLNKKATVEEELQEAMLETSENLIRYNDVLKMKLEE